MTGPPPFVVCIPARDEALRIPRVLVALGAQRRPGGRKPSAVVVADSRVDQTAGCARSAAAAGLSVSARSAMGPLERWPSAPAGDGGGRGHAGRRRGPADHRRGRRARRRLDRARPRRAHTRSGCGQRPSSRFAGGGGLFRADSAPRRGDARAHIARQARSGRSAREHWTACGIAQGTRRRRSRSGPEGT